MTQTGHSARELNEMRQARDDEVSRLFFPNREPPKIEPDRAEYHHGLAVESTDGKRRFGSMSKLAGHLGVSDSTGRRGGTRDLSDDH